MLGLMRMRLDKEGTIGGTSPSLKLEGAKILTKDGYVASVLKLESN